MGIEKEKIGRLIEQIQGGNKDAFDELYRLTSPKAYFVALQIVRNEQDAEDILQETYIKVLEKIDEIDPSQSFMGWLYRVISNKSKNLLKKRNALVFEAYEDESFEEIPDEATEFNPEKSLNQGETCREVMAAIDELSDEKRVCVIMKYFGEMTVSEIAESLEAPESTVKNRLFVARKELKSKLEKKDSTVFCSIAPAAIVVWALGKTAEAVSAEFAVSAASAAVLTGVGASSVAASTAAATATASAAATGTGVAAKVAALSVTQKVVAGVAAVSIIGGSTAGVVTVVKNKNTPDNDTTTYIEEVTTAPSQTAEYIFDFITEAEESTSETETTTRKMFTVPSISITRHSTTEHAPTKPVTTQETTTTTTKTETTTQTTTQQETTTQAESTTQTETTTQPTTTETTVQQVATLIIEVTDMDDNVVDTLTLPVDAGTEMTWDYLITLVSKNGYEAMAGIYGDGVGEVAQAGEAYTFTAEL